MTAAERRLGRVIGGRFQLLRLIGVGGMAAVYEAQHRNGKRVAVKLLHASLGASERQRKRFRREAYIANTIDHPGVVPVFDDGSDGDETYLVMELLRGETVAALQQRHGGRLPPARVLQLADALLEVLSIAHARGVVHRDIKPENLFIEASSRLRVLDFGVAQFEHVPGATVATQAGAMLGTPAFMCQEQARGRWDEVDARSDVWAAGATLFTLLSGELVHVCETANEQLGRAMTTPARSLYSVAPELPAELIAVIDRALRFERDERWQDAASMRAALQAIAIEGGTGVAFAASELAALPSLAAGVTRGTAPSSDAGSWQPSRARAPTGRPRVALAWIAVLALIGGLLFGLRELGSPPTAKPPAASVSNELAPNPSIAVATESRHSGPHALSASETSAQITHASGEGREQRPTDARPTAPASASGPLVRPVSFAQRQPRPRLEAPTPTPNPLDIRY